MARVSYFVATSLDGYIAGPQGELDWLHAFDASTQDYGHADFLARVDGLVMGRRTFEFAQGLGEWPYPGRPCWVLTHQPGRLQGPLPPEVMPTAAGPLELQQIWRRRHLAHAWLLGGGETAAAFLGSGQLHELIVATLPVTLGSGRPLFAPGAFNCQAWRPQHVQRYDSGIVQTHYLAVAR